ncbi:uncharacterized protein cp110 isoform 2-T2 [Polymixia lowei]
MEDYDEFVQHRLSQLRKSQDNQPPTPVRSCSDASSVICFHGQPILPPLLSGKTREDMQSYKDALQKSADQRKSKADGRVAYVQHILHSVQLRKAPTLEEFSHEDTTTESSHSYSTNKVSLSQNDDALETKDSLSFLSPSGLHDRKGGICVPPLTSTTYCAYSTHRFTLQQNYQEGFSIDQTEEKLASQPTTDPLADISHQSLSSGYVTYENAESSTSVCGRIEAVGESHTFGSAEGPNNSCGFFFHNTSNTITKMPDIISHPPIDGELLEKSTVLSSVDDYFIPGDPLKDICNTPSLHDSVVRAHSAELVTSHEDEVSVPQTGSSQGNLLESTDCEDNPPIIRLDDLGQDQTKPANEGMIPVGEASCPGSSQTLATHSTNQLHFLNRSRETEPADKEIGKADLSPSEEPYRLSLQALLKKSQEYRRHQRILRNQAKNSKIQERAREQPRLEEEQGLSDKENDEFPFKGTITTEGRKTKEKSGLIGSQVPFPQSLETSPDIFWKDKETSRKEGIFLKEYHGEKFKFNTESTCLTGDENTGNEGEAFPKNNQLVCTAEVRTEPKQIDSFFQPQPVISADNSPVQESFYLTSEQSTTCTLSGSKGVQRFKTLPSPQLCTSPVRCKSKGTIKSDGAIDGVGAPKRKVLVNTALNVDNKVETEVNLGHKSNRCPRVSPVVHLVKEGNAAMVLARSSAHAEQMDQLELNLSSLKVLISDLESTLTENRDNHGQTNTTNLPSDLCCDHIEHSDQINKDQNIQVGQNDCLEDRPDDDRNEVEQEESDCDLQKGQSLDNYKNRHEDTGPNPSDPKDPPLLALERGNESVNGREVKLVKTLATERGMDKVAGEGSQTTSGVAPCRIQWSGGAPLAKDLSIIREHDGCKKQRPSTKRVASLAQMMRVPDLFRKVPSNNVVPRKGPVLSDTSNQLTGRRLETTVGEEDSSHCLSLNQSYDVDTPSGLWLLEGSGSDLGSEGRQVLEEYLTPESGGGGQGGISKVKRRLLMHGTEGNEERGGDRDRADRWTVRPHSSTPKASLQWREGRGDPEEKQLQQAHAAQVRALQDEHRRQQEELLQPTSPLPECYRPLVSAAVKGFLTRRLLRTERVAQLLRTIKDTQQFLQAWKMQNPGRGELCSRQDLLLNERVTLQLRSARYEVYDIFFSLPAGERMQLISWDRELTRERELRRQSGNTGHSVGKSSLSAATQKSLERKRGVMIQKKAAERKRGIGMRAGHRPSLKAEKPSEPKRGQFRANPQRVPKITYSCRP